MMAWRYRCLVLLICYLSAVNASQKSCLLDGYGDGNGVLCALADNTELLVSEAGMVESGTSCFYPCEESDIKYRSLCRDGQWDDDPDSCNAEAINKTPRHREKRGFWGDFGCAVSFGLFCRRRPRDDVKPNIKRVADIHVYADPIQTNSHHVTWQKPTATDNKDGKRPVYRRIGPGPHYTFPEGRTPVTYSAKDKTGNRGDMTFQVYVKVVRCTPPSKTYPNGYYVCHPSTDFVEGTQCRYGCYSGYEILGRSVRECERTGDVGRWSIQEPKCTTIKCPSLPMPKEATYTCTDKNNFKSKCTYECRKGFGVKPGMSRIRVCTADKIWRGKEPVCVDSEAPKFTSCPSYQTFYTERTSRSGFVSWKEPKAKDNSGHYEMNVVADISNNIFVTAGSYKVVVTLEDKSGNRARDCSFKVVVRELKCPAQYPHPYMKLECPRGYRYGYSCNFTCQSGYGLDGADKNTRCDKPHSKAKYVEWTKQQPLCHPLRTCSELHNPDNGALACDLWENGRYCQMQCMAGTDLPPSMPYRKLFVCGDSGDWDFSGKVPDCAKIQHPSHHKATMEFYAYFQGECFSNIARDQIKANFITALKISPFDEAWANRSDSVAGNVKVSCGSVNVKRSVNETHGSRYHISMVVQTTVDSSIAIEQQYYDNRHRMNMIAQFIGGRLQNNISTLIPGIDDVSDVGITDVTFNVDCPTGTSPSHTTYSCVGCVRGSYYNEAKGQCEECPVGEYTDNPDQTICKKCPLHTTTLMTGSAAISKCEDLCHPGFFSYNGVEPCSPCEAGFHQHSWGSTSCLQCPGSQTTLTEGSDREDMCKEFDIEFTDSINSTASMEVTITDEVMNNLTLSFWMRSLSIQGHILTVHVHDTELSFDFENGTLMLRLFGSQLTSKLEISDTMWHQYIVQINNDVVEIFSDGTSIKRSTLSEDVHINGTMTVELGGNSFVGSVSQVNINRGQTSPPFNKCFSERGDILAWPMFSNARFDDSFLQIPSECDDQDGCVSSPCHHGECSDSLGGYTCSCDEGFTGGDCEVNMDDCGGNVCANNGTCLDGVANYTCLCTPQFTGELCDDHLVHGQWGIWGNWTFCTEECGGGTHNRSRRCDNPLPQNGGQDCEGSPTEEGPCNTNPCPVCHEVNPPNNGSFDCTSNGKMLYCNVTCNEGFDFDIPPLDVYECGDLSGYEWNFHTEEHPYHRLPSCMEMSPPETMTMHYEAEYIDLTCDKMNQESTRALIKDVLMPQIESVPCVLDGHCKLESVLVNHCDGEDRKERSPAAGFTIFLSTHPTIADMEVKMGGLRITMMHLKDSATGGVFTVNRGGNNYFLNINSGSFTGGVKCPTGLQRNNAFCAPCGQGTFLHQGYCEVCEKGRYQDLTGQGYCKMCPLGKTTKGRGAVTSLECDVDEDGSSMHTAVLAGTLSVVCLIASAVVILIYMKIKSSDNKVDAEKDRHYIQQKNTHFNCRMSTCNYNG